MTASDAWWGNLHLRPAVAGTDPLGANARGAYANVLALAKDEDGFRELVEPAMASLGLRLVEIENGGPFDPDEAEGELVELHLVLSDQHPVQYKTFHTFQTDDA